MKKALFSLFFAIVACTVSAQLNAVLFPPLNDSISVNSAGLATNPTGISGVFSQSYLFKKVVGDTAFTATTTVFTSNYPFWRRLYGLTGGTAYEVRSVVNKNGVSDTSSSRFFTTKDSIPPQEMSLSNILINPGINHTDIMMHYRAVGGYEMDVNFWYQNYQYSTSPLRLSGEGDTVIVVANPNVPNTLYANNSLYATTVGIVPGINPDTFFIVSNYQTPSQQSADVEYAIITGIGQDTLVLTASIKTGNTGSAVITMDFLNALGNIIQTLPVFTITHDTILTWKITNLATFTYYSFRVKAANGGGMDVVQTPNTRTLQVPLPSIVTADTTLAGFSSTKLVQTINTNGNWSASVTKSWVTWVDSLNQNRTSDTVFGIVGMQTVVSSLLNKLFENPQTNYVTLYASNGAGTVSQPMQFKLPARKAGFLLQGGVATPTGFTTIELSGLNYALPSGTIGTALVKRTKIAPVVGAPVTILLGSNLTGTFGALPASVQSGLDTGATYQFQFLGVSQDHDTVANPTILTATTFGVKGPKIGSFIATVVYVDSVKVVSTDTIGNTGGMLLEYALCDSNDVVLSQLSNTVATTTGQTAKSKTGLQPGTKYVFKHKVSAANAPADTARITFYTLPVLPATVTVTETHTKEDINLSFTVTTNGSWAGSVIDSFVSFDNGIAAVSSVFPIGIAPSGVIQTGLYNLSAGSVHTITGYVRNVFGIKTPFSITVTTTPNAGAGTVSWGYLQQEGATKISLNQLTYTNVSGTLGTIKVSHRKIQPNTTAWSDTATYLPGLVGTGTAAKITVTGLDPTSRYEFQIFNENLDGVLYANPTINWENTMAPQQPKINDITTDQVNLNTVNGEVIGEANGTDAEESHKLFQIASGNSNQLASSNVTPVGMDDFTVAYSFPLPGTGYYEVRGKVAKVGDINPYGFSKFFNNTALGVEEITFDAIRPILSSSAYTVMGELLEKAKLPAELMVMFPEKTLLIVPDDNYYRAEYGGKLYYATK